MNGKDLLITLGDISHKYYDEAENDTLSPGHKASRRPLLIAAIIGLMLLLMGCAVVAMRLQHLTIREETAGIPPETAFNGEEINLVSIQGYMGTDSYTAFKEWQDFLSAYDPDNSILQANDDFRAPEAYFSYICYSQEMVDKLTEICEKYNLKPLGKPWFYDRAEDVFEAVGIESAFAADAQPDPQGISGYCYEDGTFSLEGDIALTGEWNELVSFDYRSVQKTSFDGVSRNIGNADEYDQWNYTMKDGTVVLLALKEEASLIIVDKEDSFVTVAALGVFANGSPFGDVPSERAFLEAFCDCFDFTYQTQKVDSTKADALYQAQLEREANQDHLHVTGATIAPEYLDSYAGWIDYMVNEMKYQDLEYSLMDIDSDGVEELLLQCKHIARYNGDENSFFSLVTIKDGEIWTIFRGSNFYLCQGGVIEEGYTNGHYYNTVSAGLESVVYSEKEEKWYKKNDWTDASDPIVVISEEEANAIMAKYPRMDIDFKPVEEFPTE